MCDFQQNTYTNGAPKRRQYTTAEDEMRWTQQQQQKQQKNCEQRKSHVATRWSEWGARESCANVCVCVWVCSALGVCVCVLVENL